MILHGESIEAYHAQSAISSSKLKVFRASPLLYHRTYNLKLVERPRTPALTEGAGFDTMVFDGVLAFEAKYAVKPSVYYDEKTGESKKWNGNAKVCQAWEATQEASGKEILPADAWSRFVLMNDAIKRHPLASALLSQGKPQVTFRVQSEKDFLGLEIQTRPDWFSADPIDRPDIGLSSHGFPYIVDLKTTADFDLWFDQFDAANPRVGSPVWSYEYDKQAALAQWVIFQEVGQTAQFLLVVEKGEPFRVAVLCLSEDWLEAAWSDVRQDLRRLNACRIANKWPGSPEHLLTLVPPTWLLERAARTAAVTA